MISHVVLLKLLDRTDSAECVDRLHALVGRCAGLLSLTAGADVLGTTASYDVSIVASHEDLAGLTAYADDPVHQEFLGWLRPRLAARVVVDSAGERRL